MLWFIIDCIQQWKMKEMWNPFHRQNYLISKGFSSFERTSSIKIWLFYAWNNRETDLVFPGNFDVVWGLSIYVLGNEQHLCSFWQRSQSILRPAVSQSEFCAREFSLPYHKKSCGQATVTLWPKHGFKKGQNSPTGYLVIE